jgi:alanyl-tRNA synthetase
MTKKLYYYNAYQNQATAIVEEVQEKDGKIWLSLDQTIFYPGGGGQLPDKGQIDDFALLDIKEENDLIWHGLHKKSTYKAGDSVSLTINWDWRYYNMQQHGGQHLLSYVLDEFKLPTISVHLGENYTTIEVDGDIEENHSLQEIERRSNELIRKSLPVHTNLVSREEADHLPLRKPAGDWKNLRVVEIDKMDYSACGGTHVRQTAEIGYIKISGVEKIRGNTRIQAHIGQRAEQLFTNLFGIEAEMKQELQVEPEKYPERIRAIKSELAETKSRMINYRKEYIRSTAEQILENNGSKDRIFFRDDELLPEDVQDITRHLAKELGKISLGISGNRFYLMAPENSEFSTMNFLQKMGPDLTMRGGGPMGFAQGIIQKALNNDIYRALAEF